MKEIFTGYAWRPMTPEEIEIMDATRVLPFKSEEPDAGDIYEGMDAVSETILNLNGIQIVPEGVLFTPQNWGKSKRALQEPCVYCDRKMPWKDEKGLDLRFSDPTVFVYGNRLKIEYDSPYCNDCFEREYEISFCPMCGRKLEVEG